MAQLAIKGHPTRGKEVIQLLEMLGGNNIHNYGGTFNECYIIDNNKICTIYTSVAKIDNCTIFTLEEFEKLYPYKVGDKISSKYLKNYKIEKMEWKDTNNKIIYKLQGMGWYNTNELQPYKEETMEEPKELIIGFTKDDNGDWVLNTHKDYEIKEIEGKYKVIKKKPQYPKTYIECAKILNCFSASYIDGYKNELLEKLQELLICRDAYWKIAGEQMGLGKSWEPDWSNGELKWCMSYSGYCIEFDQYKSKHHVLTFPTEEMRDAFYENFKDLIENVKELL